MGFLKDSALVLFIAAFWGGAVYFATAALIPGLAYPAALLAVIGAMLALLFLRQTQRDQAGLPVGLLLLFPFVCVTAGVIWWLMRLLGLLG